MTKLLIPENCVILVAPYSPIGSCPDPHLGAAKKIELIAGILLQLGHEVVLINSAHNRIKYTKTSIGYNYIGHKNGIFEITPFTLINRKIGKLLNIIYSKSLAQELALRTPLLVWIYNGYAFEAKFANELHSFCGCPIVVEIEDMHAARCRVFNPKPLLDDYYLTKVLHKSSLITCVNNEIFESHNCPSQKKMLLPSVIDRRLINSTNIRVPFALRPFRLGYFGGLTAEKGADAVLRLGDRLPPDWHMVVTGSGELARDFTRLASKHPVRIKFIHHASDEELYREMLACDAIINPHQSISAMGDGIFPFKVFEALASGRLLLSTPLPKADISLDKAVMFINNTNDLTASLEQAKAFYQDHEGDIDSIKKDVASLYSEESILIKIKNRLNI